MSMTPKISIGSDRRAGRCPNRLRTSCLKEFSAVGSGDEMSRFTFFAMDSRGLFIVLHAWELKPVTFVCRPYRLVKSRNGLHVASLDRTTDPLCLRDDGPRGLD